MRRLVFAAAFVFATPALSQEGVPDSACTYETCALQIERTSLGVRLVRGGVPVAAPPARSGLLSRVAGVAGPAPLPIAEAVASSPAALAHIGDWQRKGRVASGLVSGALLTLSTVYVLGPFDVLSDEVRSAALVGAVGLGAASFPLRASSRRSRDRAIETYNDGLKR